MADEDDKPAPTILFETGIPEDCSGDQGPSTLAQIAALEAQTLRAIREFIISGDIFAVSTQAQYRLQNLDSQIASLRATLEK